MLPIYVVLLFKVHTGIKFKFTVWTTWLLLLSSISAILFAYSNSEDITHLMNNTSEILNGTTAFAKDFFFNEATWVFAFQYYTIARAIPYTMAGDQTPDEHIEKDKWLNRVMIVLNFIFPLLEGVGYYLGDHANDTHKDSYKA